MDYIAFKKLGLSIQAIPVLLTILGNQASTIFLPLDPAVEPFFEHGGGNRYARIVTFAAVPVAVIERWIDPTGEIAVGLEPAPPGAAYYLFHSSAAAEYLAVHIHRRHLALVVGHLDRQYVFPWEPSV